MAKIVKNKLNKEFKAFLLKKLLEEIGRINSSDKLKKFLNKFLTHGEQMLILRRLAVEELIKNKKKYREIKELLDVSGQTISAVKDILLGYGYDKRDKKRKYSILSKPNKKRYNNWLSKFPTKTGKGRWRFLNM